MRLLLCDWTMGAATETATKKVLFLHRIAPSRLTRPLGLTVAHPVRPAALPVLVSQKNGLSWDSYIRACTLVEQPINKSVSGLRVEVRSCRTYLSLVWLVGPVGWVTSKLLDILHQHIHECLDSTPKLSVDYIDLCSIRRSAPYHTPTTSPNHTSIDIGLIDSRIVMFTAGRSLSTYTDSIQIFPPGWF
jgi:hypothetical protein